MKNETSLHYLPLNSRQKFLDLELSVSSVRSATSDFFRDAQNIGQQIHELTRIIARHKEAMRQVRREESFVDYQLEEYTSRMDTLVERQQAILDRSNSIADKITPDARLLDKLTKYIEALSVPAISALPVALNKSELNNLPAALAEVRETIAKLESKIAETNEAPRPISESIESINATVDRWAHEGRSNIAIHQVVDGGSLQNLFTAYRAPNGPFKPDEVTYLLAALFPDEIKKTLSDMVSQEMQGETGLSQLERNNILAKAKADKLSAERRENAILSVMQESNISFTRRENADPRAFLEIE